MTFTPCVSVFPHLSSELNTQLASLQSSQSQCTPALPLRVCRGGLNTSVHIHLSTCPSVHLSQRMCLGNLTSPVSNQLVQLSQDS